MSAGTAIEYHEATKHRLNRYARSLGYLDWDNQPNPFRAYQGAPLTPLARPAPIGGPRFDDLYDPGDLDVAPLDRRSIAQLLFDSFALSAWKQGGGNTWSLRCNPSSGNLHPTEVYLALPTAPDLAAGVYHYTPFLHALERRVDASPEALAELTSGLPPDSFLVGLAAIPWREAWKYGERAFRYCQHDAGHAIAALAYAAAALGWQVRLVDPFEDDELAAMLGIDGHDGVEFEEPDCLAVVARADQPLPSSWQPPPSAQSRIAQAPRLGERNRLSDDHERWEIIEQVAAAVRRGGDAHALPKGSTTAATRPHLPTRDLGARAILRQRRSAVDFDGATQIDRASFLRMLARTTPSPESVPLAALPGRALIHLLVFVHRVDGVPPGLYALVRDSAARERLETCLGHPFARVTGTDLELFSLVRGDVRRAAQVACCHQDIAADGAFAVAMLGDFESPLREHGAWLYRRLHWEAGAIGQVLYLEAEAAGVRGTGIGCFFDDVIHELAGIRDRSFQTIYCFTVGGPIIDGRLKTLDAYHHLR